VVEVIVEANYKKNISKRERQPLGGLPSSIVIVMIIDAVDAVADVVDAVVDDVEVEC